MPVALSTYLIAVAIVLLGRFAAALDTTRLTPLGPSWKSVVVAWGALLVAIILFSRFVNDPLRAYYKTHYARTFRLPAGSMEPTLLIGDYVITDRVVYRWRAPRQGDIVVFRYPADERRESVTRIVALPGDEVLLRGRSRGPVSTPSAQALRQRETSLRTIRPAHRDFSS